MSAGERTAMDVLSLHRLNAQALLAEHGERQPFENFLGEDSFGFSGSLAFKTPWPLEEPRMLQVALNRLPGT